MTPTTMSARGAATPNRRARPATTVTVATIAMRVTAICTLTSLQASRARRVHRASRGLAELAEHRLSQRVQADATDVERAAVEVLEVEGVAFALADLVAQLHPEPLADLVGRRLTGPAEVAVELEAQEALLHVGVAGEEGPGLVIGPLAAA